MNAIGYAILVFTISALIIKREQAKGMLPDTMNGFWGAPILLALSILLIMWR